LDVGSITETEFYRDSTVIKFSTSKIITETEVIWHRGGMYLCKISSAVALIYAGYYRNGSNLA